MEDDDQQDIHVRVGPGELHIRRPRRRGRHRRREPERPHEPAPPRRRPRRRERTPEEEAYREARRVANAKVGFMTHLVAFGSVCLFLLFVAGFRVAFIVAMSWGIGLALHYFAVIIAPGLRRRLVDKEVERQVSRTAASQRQELSGAHARHLEELSASIAHEIRNPITAAKSLVGQMGEDPAAQENIEYAKVALEELDRVEKSISHLLRFARDEDVRMQEMHLADVVESALETFRDRLDRRGVVVARELAPTTVLDGDPEKLRRVVINLLGNALDAFDEAGTDAPHLQILAGENLAGTEVWVRIRDNGPGIEPERLAKIFSPFYTSKSQGTGLGLAISKKVIDAHGGSLQADSEPGNGTEFVLTLPKHHAQQENPS